MPVHDAGDIVLKTPGVVQNQLARLGIQGERLEEHRQFQVDDVLELADSPIPELADKVQGRLQVEVEELLEDQHKIVQLAFDFDFLAIGDQVVAQGGGVDTAMDQLAQRTALKNRRVELGPLGQQAQVGQSGGEVAAEGAPPHLEVIDRVGQAQIELVVHLP